MEWEELKEKGTVIAITELTAKQHARGRQIGGRAAISSYRSINS